MHPCTHRPLSICAPACDKRMNEHTIIVFLPTVYCCSTPFIRVLVCPWYVGSAGSIEHLLEEYINNMDLPVNSTSAFFKCSSSQSFPLSPFNSSPGSQLSLIDQRLKMIAMSTISQLCHVVFECICLLRGGDSDAENTEGNSSTLNPAKACYEKLVRT